MLTYHVMDCQQNIIVVKLMTNLLILIILAKFLTVLMIKEQSSTHIDCSVFSANNGPFQITILKSSVSSKQSSSLTRFIGI